MRVAIVDPYYQPFLRAAYAATPALAEASYEDQRSHLLGLRFGTSDAYSTDLVRLGHEASELIANCVPLQRAWLRTSRTSAARRSLLALLPARWDSKSRLARAWLAAILHEQIRELDPDVVYLQDPCFIPPRIAAGPARLVVGQLASVPPRPAWLNQLDLLITSFPHIVSVWRSQGIDTEYLPLAFDARIIDELCREDIDPRPAASRPHQLTFVGGLDPTFPQHRAGVELMELVARELPLEVWGYGADRLDTDSPLRLAYRGEAWGVEMYRTLAQSQIVINRHGPVAEGYANNMRLFEATGMGATLVTETAPNLRSLFSADEVATYGDASDLLETLRSLLIDDRRRLRLAAEGHQRVLTDHTYSSRIEQLVPMLEERLTKRGQR